MGGTGGDVPGSKSGDVAAMGGDVSTSPRTGGDVLASRPASPTSPAKFNRFHFDDYSSLILGLNENYTPGSYKSL